MHCCCCAEDRPRRRSPSITFILYSLLITTSSNMLFAVLSIVVVVLCAQVRYATLSIPIPLTSSHTTSLFCIFASYIISPYSYPLQASLNTCFLYAKFEIKYADVVNMGESRLLFTHLVTKKLIYGSLWRKI